LLQGGIYGANVATGLAAQPNVVLLLVGSNDCANATKQKDTGFVATVSKSMVTLLDWIYQNDARVTVVLATLPLTGPTSDPNLMGLNDYFDSLNAEYRRLVDMYAVSGHRIVLADQNTGWFQQPQDGTLNDVLHPNHGG
jgi:lysophospholipase L1-like esterase